MGTLYIACIVLLPLLVHNETMKPEIEVKFLDINFNTFREVLSAVGAVCEQPMRDMRRAIIQNEQTGWNKYIRVRDEGDRVTVTYKSFASLSLHGASEAETTVGDFDTILTILAGGGLVSKSYQESRRETWRLDDAEIVLDEWPWLKPYIEIEGPSEEAVRDTAARLGLDWERDARFGDVMVAYRAQYPHLTEKQTIGDLAEVKFDNPLPDLLKS